MSFNPDPTKPAREVIFSKKFKKKYSHLSVTINHSPLTLSPTQRRLRLVLDLKLTF